MIVIWNPGFVCWFLEYVFSIKTSLVFVIFKIGFEFDTSAKIFQFFIKIGFIEICLSWNKV